MRTVTAREELGRRARVQNGAGSSSGEYTSACVSSEREYGLCYVHLESMVWCMEADRATILIESSSPFPCADVEQLKAALEAKTQAYEKGFVDRLSFPGEGAQENKKRKTLFPLLVQSVSVERRLERSSRSAAVPWKKVWLFPCSFQALPLIVCPARIHEFELLVCPVFGYGVLCESG